MKDQDFDIETKEILSNLERLKAKYSFSFDDNDKKAPEIADDTVVAAEKEPEIAIATDKAKKEETIDETIIPVDDTPEKEAVAETNANDMSWLIDSDDNNNEVDEPVAVEEEPAVVEKVVAEEPVVEEEPAAEPVDDIEPEVAWYLTTDDVEEDEGTAEEPIAVIDEDDEADISEDKLVEEPVEELVEEQIEADSADETVFVDKEESDYEAPSEEKSYETDDEEDEFADLDDDDELVVIRHDETHTDNKIKSEDKKEEVSPFFAAFMENTAKEAPANKPPKPVKSPKPAKPVKEPKEKKTKEKKPLKKSLLNIVVAVVLAVALWGCLFATDIILVSNWSAPIFCAESESYADGSKTYTGAFYQIQISVNDDGTIDRVSLPWFAKGPNGEK